MGRKTNIPIRAESPRKGDRVAARHIETLANQVRRLSRQGQENYASAFPNVNQPFTPRLRRKPDDSSVFQISLSLGYVIESLLVGDKSLEYHKPDGIVDMDDNPVWHDIESGECLYVKVEASILGEITGVPDVAVDADDLDGEHYRPEMFDFAGNAGEHNYKICKFTAPDELELFCAGSHIVHYDERVTMINLEATGGEAYKVGKDYDNATDEVNFRQLVQLDGEGEPIIRPWGLEEGDSIDFKRIKHLTTLNQVTVSTEGDAVLIRGNSVDGSLTHIDCNDDSTLLMEWVDGLIITGGAITFQAGCSSSSGGEIP